MIVLLLELVWTTAWAFLAASVLASLVVVVGLAGLHIAWWWEDRRRRQSLADEVEDYLRERT